MSSSPPDQPSTSGTDEDDRPSHSNDYVLDSIPTTSSEPPTSSLLTMLHVIVPEDRIYPDPAMFEEYVNRQRRIQSARSALDVLKLEEMKKEEEEEEGSDEQELEDANSGKYWCGENNVKEELVETDSKQELEESFCEEELEEPDVEKEKTPSIEVPPVEESTEQKIDRLTDTFMRDIDDEAHPIPDSSDAEDIPSGSGNSDEEEEEEEEAGGSSSSYEEGDDGVEGHSSDISSEEQDADNNEEETTITTVFQEDVMLTTAGRMAEFPNEEDDVEHEDETGIEADNESEDSSEDEARSEFDFSLVCLPSSSSIQPLEQFDPSDNGEWKTSYDVTYQMIREGMEVDEESAGPSHDIFKEVLSKDDFSTRQDEDRDEGMVGPSGTTREDRNEDAGSSKSIHRDVENDLDDRACSSSNESSDSYDESCELEIRPNEHDVEPETVEMEIDREAEGPFDENHAGLKRAKDDDKPVEEVSSISTHDDDPLEALQAAGPSGESSNGDSNDFEISTSVTSEDDAVTGKLPDSIAGTSIQEYLSNSDDVTDVPEPDDLTSSFDTDQSEEAAVEELSTQLSENHNKVPDPKDPIGRTDSDESDTTIRDVSEDEIDSDNSNITVNGLSELSFSENVADDSNNVPDKEVRTVPLEEVASGSSPDESEVEAASEVEEQLLYEDAEVADPDESSSHSSEDDVSYDFAPSVSSEDHSVKNVDVSTSGVQDSAAHVNEVGLEELFLNEMDEDLASRSCSSEEEPDVDMEDENLSSGSSDSFEDRPPDDMEDRSFSSGSSESLEERYFDDIKDDEYSSDYHEQLDEQYIDEVEDDEYSAGSRASMDDDEMEDEHLSSVSGDSPPGSYRDEIDDEESSDGFGESQDGPNVEDEDQSFFSDESLDGSYRDDMEDGEATSGDSLDEPDVDQLEGEANSSASGESLAESYRDEMEDQNLSPGSGESLDGRYTDDSEDDEYSSDFHESVDAADANYSLVAPGSPVSEESVDQCEVDQLDDFLEIHIVMDQIVETVVNDFEAGTSYNQDADGLFDAEDDQFDLEDKGSEAEQDQLDSEVEPSHHEAEESQFDIEDEDFEADQDHLDSGDDNSEAGPSHRVVEEDQHNHEDVEENHFDSEDEVVEPSQYVAEGTMETGDDLPEAVSEDDSSLSESDSHVSEKNCILFEDSPIMSETEIDLLEVELDHFNQQEDEEESLQESESENSLQESDSEGALHDSGSEHSVQETEENESDTEQHDDDYREEEHGANVHDDLSPSTQEIEEEDDTNVDEPESYCEDSDEFIDDEEDREGYESVDNDSYVCSDDEEEPGGMPTAAGSNTDLSEFARNDEEKEHNSEYSESNCDDSYKCSDDEDDLEHGLEDEPTVNVEDDLAPGDVAMSEEIEAEDLEPNTGVSELTHDDDKDGISEGSDYHCHESRGGSDKEDDPEEVKSTPSDFRVGRGEVTVSDLPNHVANDQFDWSLYGDFPIADKLFDWTPFLETNHDTSHSIYFDCAAIESQDDDFYTADEDESISSEPESYSDSEQEALSSTSRPASSTDGEEERDDRRIRTMPMYSSGSGDSEDSESEHVDHEEDVDSDHSVEKSPLGNLDEIIESFKIADLPMDVEERVLALAEKTCFVLPSSDESTDSESSEVGGDYYLDENVTNSSDDTSEFLDDNVKGESPFEDSLREVEDHLEHVLDIFGKSQYELQSEIPVCSVTLTQGEDELSHSKLIAAEVLKSGEVLVEGFDSETDNVSGEVVKVETDEMTVEDIKDEFVENEEDDEFESESETEFDIENDLTEEDLEGIGVVPSFLPEIQESLVWTKKEVVEAAVFLHTIGRKKVVIDYSDDDEVTEDGTRDDEDNESDDASDEDEKEEEEPVRIPPTESDAALSDPQTEADGPVLEPKVESDDALLKPEVEMTDALLDAEVKLESPDPPNPEMESETSESSSDDELEEPTSFPVLRETYVHQRYGSESPVSGHYSSSEESDPDATMMADVKKEPIDDVTVPFVKEEIMDEIKQEVEDDFGQQEMNPLALTTLLDEIKCEDVKMEVEEKYDVDGEQEEQQPESSVSSDATSSISLSFVSSTVSSTDQSIASSSTLPETTVSQFLESADLAEAAPPEESSSDSSDWESDDGLHVKTEGLFKEILTGDFGIPFDQLFHFNEGVIEKAYELLKDFSWRQEVKSDFKRFKQLKDAEFRKRAANSTRQEPDVSNLIVIGASDSTLSEPSDKASTSAEKKKRRRVEEVVPKTEEDENEPTLTNGTEPPIAVNDMKEESSDESENEVEPTPEELWAEFIKERRAKIEEQFTHDEFDFLQEVVTGLMRKIHGPLKRAELMSHASAVLISHMYDKVENIAPSCPGFRALTPEEELPVHPGIEDEQGQPDAAANAEGTESSGEDVLSGNDAPPTTTSRRGRRRRLLATTHASSPMVRRDLHEMSVSSPRPKLDSPQPSTSTPLRAARFSERFETRTPERRESSVPLSLPSDPAPDMASEKISTPTLIASPPSETVETPKTELKDTKKKEVKDEKAEEDTGPSSKTRQRRNAAAIATAVQSVNNPTPTTKTKKETNGRKKNAGRGSAKKKEEEEPTYCTCERVSFGEMIGCDNDKCEIEWFHFECVQLTSKPKGRWYCPNCRNPDNAKLPKTASTPATRSSKASTEKD